MEFEWDEKKRIEILNDRDVDLLDAALIFENSNAVVEWEDSRRDYGEKRFIAVGIAEGTAYQLVYTWRGAVMRLITAWRITDEDYKKYKTRNS